MIKKVLFSLIFLCLCIAVPLALMGYKHVDLGSGFIGFMSNCSHELESFKIGIPDIPPIPKIDFLASSGGLEVLFNILNAIIGFFNVIINIINIGCDVINIVISLVQFIVIVIKNLIWFKDSLQNTPLPVV